MILHQSSNSEGNYNFNQANYRGRDFAAHFHKNIELIYIRTGEMTVTADRRQQTVPAGEWAIILPNQIHSLTGAKDSRFWVTVFSADHVPCFADAISGRRGQALRFRCPDAVQALVDAELIDRDPDVPMRCACLYAVCSAFLRTVPLVPREEKSVYPVSAVLDYIAANFRSNISLRSCAQELNYEYHYLSRLLEKNYKIGFRKTLNEYRVQAALELLHCGQCSITEAAFESGFQSVRSFNDIIKKSTGKTPAEHRIG